MKNKTQAINDYLRGIAPYPENYYSRKKCTGCNGAVGEFKDRLSQREYSISGLCQECQDTMFGVDDEDY